MNASPDSMALADHIERHIGRITETFDEIARGEPPLLIHHVKSTLFRRYEVVITSGMSALPMNVPAGCPETPYAELLVVLPKGWPLSKDDFGREQAYWPLRLLKDVARYPFATGSWLGFGHTVASSDSEEATGAYAPRTGLCAAIALPPMTLGERHG